MLSARAVTLTRDSQDKWLRKTPLASSSTRFIGLVAVCTRGAFAFGEGGLALLPVATTTEAAPATLRIRDEGVGLTSRGAATITIKRVLAESAGLYECRVDFFRSPTHNSFVNLTVIEPPKNVEIADSQSGASDDGIVGPYYENQEVILNCFSRS
ncbi:uncharacterized protein LOC122242208, partial [Penaeus japonicus]|uniref:uncharacterized protein LOC122242208 n=1 Tax=Penaeus japonicus TaxID=27405 RepID=UPI001C70B444